MLQVMLLKQQALHELQITINQTVSQLTEYQHKIVDVRVSPCRGSFLATILYEFKGNQK
jgi:hypothetical protein